MGGAPAGGETTTGGAPAGGEVAAGGEPAGGAQGGEVATVGDLIEVATADGRFTILAEALAKAELVDALKGDGPFTVFAPTDDAFNALIAANDDIADKDALLNLENLGDILKYHVLSGKIESGALEAVNVVTTISDDLSGIVTMMMMA